MMTLLFPHPQGPLTWDMPLSAMAFSECRMRLTALEVNVSIWLSDKGWTTSDSRNTFFLPLAPDILHEITQGRNQTSDITVSVSVLFVPRAHLVCAVGRMGSGSLLTATGAVS